MHQLARVIASIAFIVLALPAAAAGGPVKQHSLTMSPQSVFSTGPVILTATIVNQTPNGNSTFNSVEVILKSSSSGIDFQSPVNVVSILYATSSTAAATIAAAGTASIAVGPDGNKRLRISNINPPIKPNWKLEVKFGATVTAANCVGLQATWDSEVWTGASFSGDTFGDPIPALSQLITKGCDALLACGESLTKGGTGGTTKTTVTRFDDKNATGCGEAVPVSIEFLASREAQVVWNEAQFPNAVMKVETEWAAESIAPASWPKRTRVAWATNPQTGAPIYIDAPACLSQDPPKLVLQPDNSYKLATMPTLANDASVSDPYKGDLARACIFYETVEVQTSAYCAARSLPEACVLVDTTMWMTGDPWLSRQ